MRWTMLQPISWRTELPIPEIGLQGRTTGMKSGNYVVLCLDRTGRGLLP